MTQNDVLTDQCSEIHHENVLLIRYDNKTTLFRIVYFRSNILIEKGTDKSLGKHVNSAQMSLSQ